MKKKTYLFALMAMALTLGSCSDNENGIGGETSKYITVSTSIGNMTRVATDANGGQTFEEGDEISVYAWIGGQWKFSGDKHKSLQVDTERTFHQRYPLVML